MDCGKDPITGVNRLDATRSAKHVGNAMKANPVPVCNHNGPLGHIGVHIHRDNISPSSVMQKTTNSYATRKTDTEAVRRMGCTLYEMKPDGSRSSYYVCVENALKTTT